MIALIIKIFQQVFKSLIIHYWFIYFNFVYQECMPGYTGLDCTTTCPYPTYGDGCQGYCDCNNDMCDVSTGCRSLTTSKPLRDSILFNLLAFNLIWNKNIVFRVCVSHYCAYIDSECMPGYNGPRCNIPCPFPTFGERCQGFCNCSRNQCDVSTGCKTERIGTSFVHKQSNFIHIFFIFCKAIIENLCGKKYNLLIVLQALPMGR